jgi:hypothetical protein
VTENDADSLRKGPQSPEAEGDDESPQREPKVPMGLCRIAAAEKEAPILL